MANNRMYIKCGECGKKKMIAKYYPIMHREFGWLFMCYPTVGLSSQVASTDHAEIYRDSLDEFFRDHRHNDYSDDGPTHFSIEYESEEEI